MIGKKVKLSKESERQVIIHQLSCVGVHEGNNGEQLCTLNYFSLWGERYVKKAVQS